jgi:uncharacterized protein (DUF362 family)/Pyruvate/2-oxoacid:ferredoxin oxidoreductase delta subunit
MARVALSHCTCYDTREVEASLAAVISGALEGGGGAIAGKRVLVKPNLLAAREPSRGVTTHPAVVAAAVDHIRAMGADVSIGDSPGGAVRGVQRVWENTGMLGVARSRGVPLVNFEAAGWREREVGGRTYAMARALDGFDLMVSVAKFKTHVLTLLTGSIKNAFGCVPGLHKSALHLKHPGPGAMSRAIVDVFSLARPWLNILDAVESMDRNGPSSGRVVRTGLLGASTDAVALDSVFADLVSLRPSAVPVIREAARRGLGEASLDEIAIVGGDRDEYRLHGFEIPSNWAFRLIPGVLGAALARFLWVRPGIDRETCTACGLCADMCPAGAISFEGGGAVVDRRLCTSCLCCHEACPEGAVTMEMSRLARLIA